MLGPRFYLLFCCINFTYGANILFFWGMSTYSHRVVVWPLVEEMAAKGHNVTFYSPFPPKNPNPNVTELHPQELQDFFSVKLGSNSNLMQRRLDGTSLKIWNELPGYGMLVCDVICTSPETLAWIESTHIDLVIIDALFNECGVGIAYKFKAPHIIFDTTSVFMWQYDMYGFPAQSSWIPDMSMQFPQQMNFYQRVLNTLSPLYWYFSRHFFMFPNMEKVLRSSLNMSDMPPLWELERTTSVVLVNTHYSIEFARSVPPLFVPIAGIHCKDSPASIRDSNIPKDILKFIEESGDKGFIYVSFGGAVQISKMKPDFQQVFFSAMGNSSTRFVWKWEADRPKEMPDNVITGDWMPQQYILAHPKARGFITHGGLLGMEEAIFNAVPLIVLPIFAEQDYNAERVDRDDYGISLDVAKLDKDILQNAIKQILTDKRYKTRMTEVATAFRDRITEPLKTAVWWTEFVLRQKNKSADFLKPLTYNQTWYQRRCLDVWLVLLVLTLISLGLLVKIIMLVLRRVLFGRYSPNKKESTNTSSKKKL